MSGWLLCLRSQNWACPLAMHYRFPGMLTVNPASPPRVGHKGISCMTVGLSTSSGHDPNCASAGPAGSQQNEPASVNPCMAWEANAAYGSLAMPLTITVCGNGQNGSR